MNDLYMQGFIDRCLSQGVDPAALVKAAAMDKVIKGVASLAGKATKAQKTSELSSRIKRIQAEMQKRWDKMSPEERRDALMQN
jgi:hypothetical protein